METRDKDQIGAEGLKGRMSHESGILPVYKPKGMTSFDLIRLLKRRYRGNKFGHAGSLDPIAEGVVLILVNGATKQSNSLMDGLKVYDVEMVLGLETDTGDITGRYIQDSVVLRNEPVTREDVEHALKGFIGEFDQVIPAFSACKYQGKPRYHYARRGIELEEKKRRVMINHIELVKFDYPVLTLRVFCQRGVYLRVLCQDIGRTLQRGGVLLNLVRVSCGGYSIKEAVRLDELAVSDQELIGDLLVASSDAEMNDGEVEKHQMRSVTYC